MSTLPNRTWKKYTPSRASTPSARTWPPAEIRTGVFYTNGKYGDRWTIYQVIDESATKDQVIFKIVAGKQRGHSGIMAREKFAQSVQHEVTRNENSWQRAGGN